MRSVNKKDINGKWSTDQKLLDMNKDLIKTVVDSSYEYLLHSDYEIDWNTITTAMRVLKHSSVDKDGKDDLADVLMNRWNTIIVSENIK